jgi:hypothetical protein
MRPIVMCAVLLLFPAAALATQQTSAPLPPEQETDLVDIYRAWRKKPPPSTQPREKMIIAAPIVGSNPSAGFVFGAAGQMAFYRGDPSTTRISSGPRV